jgi:hypothetical protein
MYTNSLATLVHCQEVVRRYGLEPADFPTGSVEGFTAFLLCRSVELYDVGTLANRLDCYRQELAGGLDEAELIEEAESLSELLNDHARARREIATHIQLMKSRPGGRRLWACVAELGSAPDAEHGAICARQGIAFQDVQAELAWVKQFDWLIMESVKSLRYAPGNHPTLDGLLRKDIEVFDQTLVQAEPWRGSEPDVALEFCALHRLAP